jgi:hypothetical protein
VAVVLLVLNDVEQGFFFIINVFQLCFRICCHEGPIKAKEIVTDESQVSDLC